LVSTLSPLSLLPFFRRLSQQCRYQKLWRIGGPRTNNLCLIIGPFNHSTFGCPLQWSVTWKHLLLCLPLHTPRLSENLTLHIRGCLGLIWGHPPCFQIRACFTQITSELQSSIISNKPFYFSEFTDLSAIRLGNHTHEEKMEANKLRPEIWGK
jgi:hypothetical protein